MRRTIAAIVLAAAAVIAVPTAVNAADYTGTDLGVTITAGQPGTMTFTGFAAGSSTTATAGAAVSLATLRAASLSKAAADGTVTYQVSAAKAGTYPVTVVGQQGADRIVRTATLTVVPADGAAVPAANTSSTAMASTGYELAAPVLWIAGGAVLLGLAMLLVLRARRRTTHD